MADYPGNEEYSNVPHLGRVLPGRILESKVLPLGEYTGDSCSNTHSDSLTKLDELNLRLDEMLEEL